MNTKTQFSTVTCVLAIVAAIYALFLTKTVREDMKNVLGEEAAGMEWRIFLKSGEDSGDVLEKVKSLPDAGEIKFISKEEALNAALKNPVLGKNLSLLPANPFPDSIKVVWKTESVTPDRLDEVENMLLETMKVQEIAYNREAIFWLSRLKAWIGKINLIITYIITGAVVLVAGIAGVFGAILIPKKRKTRIAIMTTILLAASVSKGRGLALGGEVDKKDLERVQGQIRSKKEEILKSEKKEKEIITELSKVKNEIYGTRKAIDTARETLEYIKKDTKTTGSRVTQVNNDKLSRQERLADGYHRYYVAWTCNNLPPEQFILSGYVIEAAGKELQRVDMKAVELEGQLQKLKNIRVKVEREKTKQTKRLNKAEQTLASKETVYKDTVKRKTDAKEELRRLYQTVEKLKKLLAEIEARKALARGGQPEAAVSSHPMYAKKGNLSWPVEGKVTGRYGRVKHPELGTPIISNGITISAVPGSGIQAIDSGEVAYAGDFMSYGNMVLIDHGGRIASIYGYLASITVREGQKIASGEQIGLSGFSINAEPALYFELRVNDGPVDPLIWLKANN